MQPRGLGELLRQGDRPRESAPRRHGTERRALGTEGAGGAALPERCSQGSVTKCRASKLRLGHGRTS